MPDDDKRYSRLYWKLASEHPAIYADPAKLGTYMQALVAAEQAYPQPAIRPSTCKLSVWRELQAEGLVCDVPGGYSVKGLAKERSNRSARARANALSRYGKSD